MKIFVAVVVLWCVFSFSALCQVTNCVKKPVLGLNAFLNSFPHIDKHSETSKGLGINYVKGISNHVDVIFAVGGSYLDYPLKNKFLLNENHFLAEAEFMAIAKLLPDKYRFTPYLAAGLVASKYQRYYGLTLPFGIGLQMNLNQESFLFINSQYRERISNNTSNHFYFSLGLAGRIGKKIRYKPLVKSILTPIGKKLSDSSYQKDILEKKSLDSQSILVPTGKAILDSDRDGITDSIDKCPLVVGLVRYNGCPIPDSDKDGVNDEEDRCPSVPGPLSNLGCPLDDKDNDGIPDKDDKCPDLTGLSQNNGCPVIDRHITEKLEMAAKKIYFTSDSYQLLPKSYSALDQIVYLVAIPTNLKIEISGHTDDSGTHGKNEILSKKRAEAIKFYLIQHGISVIRITTNGYAHYKPVASNLSIEGRALNRRVEIKLNY